MANDNSIKTFEVQGSAANPYTVTFTMTGNDLAAHCTCPAGQKGQYCKHRFQLLDSDETIREWLRGTELESALAEMADADKDLAKAKKRLQGAKKVVAAVMRGK